MRVPGKALKRVPIRIKENKPGPNRAQKRHTERERRTRTKTGRVERTGRPYGHLNHYQRTNLNSFRK
jgi:hypothetical protein